MKIITFLGNPGKKYYKNRHNAGFLIGEKLAEEFNINIKKKDFHSLSGSGIINNSECLLLFPQTYMNNSGLAAGEALKFYNVLPDQMITVHDEIELGFGMIKHKFSGGHKGHNGIRSIIQVTGTSEFHRIRIGVGRPEGPIPVADYLLSDFTKDELSTLETLYPEIRNLIISNLKK